MAVLYPGFPLFLHPPCVAHISPTPTYPLLTPFCSRLSQPPASHTPELRMEFIIFHPSLSIILVPTFTFPNDQHIVTLKKINSNTNISLNLPNLFQWEVWVSVQCWKKKKCQATSGGIGHGLVLPRILPAAAKTTSSLGSSPQSLRSPPHPRPRPRRPRPSGSSAPCRPRPLPPWREQSSETPFSQRLSCHLQLGLKSKPSLVPLTLVPQIASEELDLSDLSFPRVVSCFLFARFFSYWLFVTAL